MEKRPSREASAQRIATQHAVRALALKRAEQQAKLCALSSAQSASDEDDNSTINSSVQGSEGGNPEDT
jgi:hypothetical protein